MALFQVVTYFHYQAIHCLRIEFELQRPEALL